MQVAIIGLGRQNLNDHLPSLIRREDVKIVAICDPSSASYSNFKSMYPNLVSVPYFRDFKDLPVKNIDFCIVSVPHDQYKSIAAFLCANKIFFMKEKPFARNNEEAVTLTKIKGFEKYGFICTQRRFSSLYQKAKESISEIGTPFLFNAIYKLNIENPAEGWRGDKEVAGGGCILDMGYHIIDQLVWWFGKPDFIAARTSALANSKLAGTYTEDTASILFGYKTGLNGTITLSRSTGEKIETYSLHGSNGHLIGDKKNIKIKNKLGELINDITTENTEEMMDKQLDFFMTRIKSGTGFKDVQENNIKNMEFIKEIYEAINKK